MSAAVLLTFNLRLSFAIRRAMTNRIALGIGLFICAAFALSFVLGLDWHIYLGRKFMDLIRLIAFWR
jgi:hypothetical protein